MPSISVPRRWQIIHYAIKSKLGVQSDIELVYFCMRQGLVTPLASPDTA